MKLTVTPAQAGIIGKAIAPVLNKDMTRPYCQIIEIASGREPGTITFTATDSYRAHRVTVAIIGAEWGDPVLSIGADCLDNPATIC